MWNVCEKLSDQRVIFIAFKTHVMWRLNENENENLKFMGIKTLKEEKKAREIQKNKIWEYVMPS